MDNSAFIFENYAQVERVNFSCDSNFIPTAGEYIDSLGYFGIGLVVIGALFFVSTVYLAADAVYNVFQQNETPDYKTNCLIILSVYPTASICSLVALAIPRTQLLTEAFTQVSLTISLYRLYLLIIDVGQRKVTKSPELMLRVGPCCCWPCLPFPVPQMTDSNLSWLGISVLQLPIIQTFTYCCFLLMAVEGPTVFLKYNGLLQPLSVASILIGLYGLTIATVSLQQANPESKLHHKTKVLQMVLLFSKLQGFIIKLLAETLFPCEPPLSPQLYANVTYNALMIIEMLLLCVTARYIYSTDDYTQDHQTDKRTTSNNNRDTRQIHISTVEQAIVSP